MNKELRNRVFDIPQNILDKINHTVSGLNGEHARGLERAKELLQDKKIKYGKLKRIIHDIQNMDKINNKLKYDLCGGEEMEKWAKTHLDGERDLISDRKDSRKRADDISGLTGQRKNSHLKKHNKDLGFKIPLNMMKHNSQKTSIADFSAGSMKLFEEIDKIKNLINY